VVLLVQFDPGDEMPVQGVQAMRLTPAEALEMAETLRSCAALAEEVSHG